MFSSNTEKIWKKSSSFNGKLNLYIAALKSVTETKPSPNESIFLNALLSPFQSEIICRNNKLVYGPFWIKVKGALGRTWLIPHIRQPWHKAKTLMANRLCSHLDNGALINYIQSFLLNKDCFTHQKLDRNALSSPMALSVNWTLICSKYIHTFSPIWLTSTQNHFPFPLPQSSNWRIIH